MKTALLGAFVALQLADVATTLHNLSEGGVEFNPLFAALGPAWSIPVKLALVGIAFAYMRHWPARHIAPFVGLMAFVVASNALAR